MSEPQLAADDGERPLALELTKIARHVPGDQLFTIAVCGGNDRPPVDTAVITSIFEAQKLHEWVKRALGAEENYRTVRGELEDWMERTYEAERQLTQSRYKVTQMEQSLSWRVTGPLRRFMEWVHARRT
jgi:hypothetical protein